MPYDDSIPAESIFSDAGTQAYQAALTEQHGTLQAKMSADMQEETNADNDFHTLAHTLLQGSGADLTSSVAIYCTNATRAVRSITESEMGLLYKGLMLRSLGSKQIVQSAVREPLQESSQNALYAFMLMVQNARSGVASWDPWQEKLPVDVVKPIHQQIIKYWREKKLELHDISEAEMMYTMFLCTHIRDSADISEVLALWK